MCRPSARTPIGPAEPETQKKKKRGQDPVRKHPPSIPKVGVIHRPRLELKKGRQQKRQVRTTVQLMVEVEVVVIVM